MTLAKIRASSRSADHHRAWPLRPLWQGKQGQRTHSNGVRHRLLRRWHRTADRWAPAHSEPRTLVRDSAPIGWWGRCGRTVESMARRDRSSGNGCGAKSLNDIRSVTTGLRTLKALGTSRLVPHVVLWDYRLTHFSGRLKSWSYLYVQYTKCFLHGCSASNCSSALIVD